MAVSSHIVFKFEYNALHHWPGEPQSSVYNLVAPHQHYFLITLHIPVKDLDREIEFIQFRNEFIEKVDMTYFGDFGARSCEMIATELMALSEIATKVEVFENEYVGAIVERS